MEYGPSDGQGGPGGRAVPPGAGAAWGGLLPPGQHGAVNPAWLAATADRERAAAVLRAGFAEGRLTADELDDRLARVYASRTYGQLWALTADLPAGPVPFQHPAGPPAPAGAGEPPSPWGSAAALVITALVIFALAALVTAIITAHAQQYVYPPPFQQLHLLPALRPAP